MPVPVVRRSINEIMYSEDELDVALFQPPLFRPIFPEDQDPVFNQYLGVVTGHAALMNDLGTEPNHGLLQLAAILMDAGIKTDWCCVPSIRAHAQRARAQLAVREGGGAVSSAAVGCLAHPHYPTSSGFVWGRQCDVPCGIGSRVADARAAVSD